MSKTLAKAKPKGKAINTSSKSAKPAKAVKGKAKPKAEPRVTYKKGDEVIFNGYSDGRGGDDPTFEKGDRLTIVDAPVVDEEKRVVLACVKAEDYEAYVDDEDSVNGDELFASEVEKAPKEAVDPYHELASALKSDDNLQAFIKGEGGDPLTAAVAAQEAVAQNMFMLGGCLALLYADQKFREYDKKKYADDRKDDDTVIPNSGWEKFCRDNFDMNGRKGLSAISIYRAFNRLGDELDLDEIATDRKIGWVKLGAMANHITKDNASELIERARSESVTDFRESIRTEYTDGGGEAGSAAPKVRRTTLKVVFYEDTAAQVEAIINAAKKQIGSEDLGTVLEYIVLDWAHNALDEKDNKKASSERKKKLTELKKSGVDTSERKKAYDNLLAKVEGGDDDEADDDDEDGDED